MPVYSRRAETRKQNHQACLLQKNDDQLKAILLHTVLRMTMKVAGDFTGGGGRSCKLSNGKLISRKAINNENQFIIGPTVSLSLPVCLSIYFLHVDGM